MPEPPAFVEPALARLVKAPPRGDGWVHEIKIDGYRIQARVVEGSVQLLTRSGLDWTATYPGVAAALTRVAARSALIDGEVAALLADGRSSFHALQSGGGALVYVAFDLLFLDGHDLRAEPLLARKAQLRELVSPLAPVVRYGDHVAGRSDTIWATVCAMELEGMISKRAGAPYRSGRVGDWLKVKCSRRAERIVGGFTLSTRREGLRGLLMGRRDGDRLVYSGKVGSGLSQRDAAALYRYLDARRVERSPFTPPPPRAAIGGTPYWVAPEVVIEVEYLEETDDGILRHPTLKAIRGALES
jgi:bifunctional non-homologous end joining protein LigD